MALIQLKKIYVRNCLCREILKNKNIQLFLIAIFIRLALLLSYYCIYQQPFSDLANWYDGDSYMTIAQSFPLPYHQLSIISNAKHYPLYPFFIYLANFIFHNIIFSAYFVVIFASSLSVVVFYNIAKRYSHQAYMLALLFTCFPPQWLLVSTFLWTEPVLILLLLMSVQNYLNDKEFSTFICLGLVGIARPVGVIFLFIFFLFILTKERKHILIKVKYFLIALIPFVLFHLYLYLMFGQLLVLIDASEEGGYSGALFSYPLDAIISALIDPNILLVRKLYSLIIFLLYFVGALFSLYFIRKKEYRLFCMLFLLYFIFCTLLKGDTSNWGFISLPRFLLPITPFGIIMVFGRLKKRALWLLTFMAVILGIAYSILSILVHLHFGHKI